MLKGKSTLNHRDLSGAGDFSGVTFFVSVFGTKGDVYPFMGLCNALQSKGAKIAFMTSDYFQEEITSLGFLFFSSGSAKDYLSYLDDRTLHTQSDDILDRMWRDYLKDAYIKAFNKVTGLFEDGHKLVIIGLWPLFNGAYAAADSLQIPTIQISLAPSIVPTKLGPPAPLKWQQPDPDGTYTTHFNNQRSHLSDLPSFKSVNRLRRSLSLEEVELTNSLDVLFSSHRIQVMLTPKWYANPPKDFPKHMNYLGFPLFDTKVSEHNAKIDNFLENNKKPIVFTGGTGVLDQDDFFEKCVLTCRMLGMPGIFVGGRPNNYNLNKTDNFIHVNYVNFEWLFPSCSLVVHHGGIGTMAQALRSRTPQIIIPRAFDQFDNADKVFGMKFGAYIFEELLNAAELAGMIDSILQDEAIPLSIKKYAKDVDSSTAISDFCSLVYEKVIKLTDFR